MANVLPKRLRGLLHRNETWSSSRLAHRFRSPPKNCVRRNARRRNVHSVESLESRQLLVAGLNGWVGSYHTSLPDATAELVRHDAMIDFDWGQHSALDNVSPSDGFSAVWEGNLQSDHTANHEFIVRTEAGDGVRVWLNDQVVIDAWAGAASDELRGTVSLVANQAVTTKVEYRDIAGDAKIWLGWTSPQLPVEVIGPEWLSLSTDQQQAIDDPGPRGILFEQLSTVPGDFLDSGEVATTGIAAGTRLTSLVAASDSTSHPAQRMRGLLVPDTSGRYEFRISGGTQSRLLIADDATPELARLVASSTLPTAPGEWDVQSSQTSTDVPLVSGVQYYVEARQASSGAYGGLQIQWRDPDDGVWRNVPEANLRPLQAEVGVRAVISAVNEPDAPEPDASTTLSFDVSRTDDFGRDLVVDLDYGGTATRAADYTGALSTVTIPAGQRSVRVDLSVGNDGVDEVLETIRIGVAPSGEYDLTTPVRTRTTLSIFGHLIPEGNSLISSDPLAIANIAQVNGTSYATFSNRTASGENSGTVNGTVLVVDTTSTPPNETTVWARWDINQDVPENETLYAEFYYRRLGVAWSPVTFNIRTTSPFRDWGKTEVTAKGFWQRARIPIIPGDPILSAESRVEMFLGTKIAKVEIANFQVKRFINDIADATPALPADAASLSNVDARSGEGTYATFTDRTATAGEQVPFQNVLNVDVHTTAPFLSQIGATWNSDIAIDADSYMTAEVWLRTDDAPFNVRLQIEQPSAVIRSLLREDLSVTGEWTRHRFRFTAREASLAGEVQFRTLFGQSAGTLEIGGIQIWNHGVPPDLSRFLPREYQNYTEREADSDWRWEARRNVLDNRRSKLEVNVVDTNGNPVSGAVVGVNQAEHAYQFGNIIKTEFISDLSGGQASTAASQRHRAIATRLFNTITIANGIRWVPWVSDRQRGIETVDWVNDNVSALHGHHLTWGQLSMIPSAVRNEYNRLLSDVGQNEAVEYLRTTQLAHVADIASELSGEIDGTTLPKIAHWDTVNHPVLLTELWDILANGGAYDVAIGEVFEVAKANSHPDTLQMFNEGQTIEFVDHPRRTEYYNLIAELLADNKPVEAVGFMNHFNLAEAPSPTQFNAHLNQFAALGLPLGMTEFDIDSTGTDLQTQADWSEDYYLNVFANPSTSFIIGYGFYELAHWRDDVGAYWYSADWEAKPNADVFVDQVHREWQTQTVGSTSSDGTYRTMAFDGQHQVTVTIGGQSYEMLADVNPSGGVANFVIDYVPQTAYEDTTVTDGTRIEAEKFDLGGSGVAYFDSSAGNTGNVFRTDVDVDIYEATDGVSGYAVGKPNVGEWLEYTTDIVAGIYDIDFRLAASGNDTTRTVRILVADSVHDTNFTDLGFVSVPLTGSQSNWQTVTLQDVDLTPWTGSDRVIRLELTGFNFQMNWFEFAGSASVDALTLSIDATSMSENGGTATATVSRNTDTTSELIVTLTSSDTSEATVPATVTIPAGQTTSAPFDIDAVDDAIADGTQTVTITAQATGHDDGTDVVDVTDDDPGVIVSPISGDTTEAGGTATFTVVLNTMSTADVTIAVSSDNTSEGTVSPASLTFTDANWNIAQTVTVTGVDDSVVDGNVSYNIVLAPAAGGDYAGIDPPDVSVVNLDNEGPFLDVDGNANADAATDGILIIRYLFGFRGDTLIAGAVGNGAARTTSAQLEAALASSQVMLDADGNGIRDAATDGILIIRYLFGFRGDSLVNGAIGANATRTTGADITVFLDGFAPPSNFSGAPPEPGAALITQKAATREPDYQQTGASFLSTVESKNVFLFQSDRDDPELPLERPGDYEPLLLDRQFESDVDWLNVISSH